MIRIPNYKTQFGFALKCLQSPPISFLKSTNWLCFKTKKIKSELKVSTYII